jgi:hypothetical protein
MLRASFLTNARVVRISRKNGPMTPDPTLGHAQKSVFHARFRQFFPLMRTRTAFDKSRDRGRTKAPQASI